MADQDRAITILPPDRQPARAVELVVPTSKPAVAARRSRKPVSGSIRAARRIGGDLRGPGDVLSRSGLEPAERRHRGDLRRPRRGHERGRLPDSRHGAPHDRHRAPVQRGPEARAGHHPNGDRGVRVVASAQPRGAPAQDHRESHRIHALPGPGHARPGDGRHACSSRT